MQSLLTNVKFLFVCVCVHANLCMGMHRWNGSV